ncbi:fibronectin type III domain-containing protein [Polaribacter septentrionalilitoris]|uniref:hypothetical protein n=1 Tax=Polaribacter septentrionalilitoris TaxID=2494657 RepID=UPI00135CBF33|nr:hypothetical protein [Polaribacter septentrionalilitoris]
MKIKLLTILSLFILFTACSNDDDFDIDSLFYSNALQNLSSDDLIGTWAIFSLKFENNRIDYPINYIECGREHFTFNKNGIYTETVYIDNDCNTIDNNLEWNLNNGIITIRDQTNQTEELVVTQLDKSNLVFKLKLDADSDGTIDVVTAYLKPYTPKIIDRVSESFIRNTSEEYRNLISYTWDPYKDKNTFTSYEIYRTFGNNCDKSNATLIKTITNINETNFTDLTPPAEENLCYFLRINITTGILGESSILSLQTHSLEADPVHLNQPQITNNSIHFSWGKSSMPYFSHYEISYSNFAPNISGYGKQNVVVAKITDINTTSFIDTNPPYLEKPFYKINVYDIFGNKTYDYHDDLTVSREVNFTRNEIININKVQSFTIHPSKPFVYFYGDTDADNTFKIRKFNYKTNSLETISSEPSNTYTNLAIQFYNSNYGEEIFLDQGGELYVYDANSLEFKYNLKSVHYFSINDFLYTKSGFWILIDGDDIYTFSRNGSKLNLIDKKSHFSEHQSSYNYNIIEIQNNQFLLGHPKESSSILYEINNDGFLTILNSSVNIPLSYTSQKEMEFNSTKNIIVNHNNNKIYSSNNFSSIQNYQNPVTSFRMSSDGSTIFGTNNNPNWSIDDESKHKKEAVFFNVTSNLVNTFETKGYPLIIFENHEKEIISISSGMKRESFMRNINNKSDLFIEIIK